jgi:hypothetical protein
VVVGDDEGGGKEAGEGERTAAAVGEMAAAIMEGRRGGKTKPWQTEVLVVLLPLLLLLGLMVVVVVELVPVQMVAWELKKEEKGLGSTAE